MLFLPLSGPAATILARLRAALAPVRVAGSLPGTEELLVSEARRSTAEEPEARAEGPAAEAPAAGMAEGAVGA